MWETPHIIDWFPVITFVISSLYMLTFATLLLSLGSKLALVKLLQVPCLSTLLLLIWSFPHFVIQLFQPFSLFRLLLFCFQRLPVQIMKGKLSCYFVRWYADIPLWRSKSESLLRVHYFVGCKFIFQVWVCSVWVREFNNAILAGACTFSSLNTLFYSIHSMLSPTFDNVSQVSHCY